MHRAHWTLFTLTFTWVTVLQLPPFWSFRVPEMVELSVLYTFTSKPRFQSFCLYFYIFSVSHGINLLPTRPHYHSPSPVDMYIGCVPPLELQHPWREIRLTLSCGISQKMTDCYFGIGHEHFLPNFLYSLPRPNRQWGPPNLLSNGYRELFPGGKAAGACSWSPTSITKVKNTWSCTSTPLYDFMAWYLVKYRLPLHDMVLIWAQEQPYLYLYVLSHRWTKWCIIFPTSLWSQRCSYTLHSSLMLFTYNFILWSSGLQHLLEWENIK
jgi:hypothetical protein